MAQIKVVQSGAAKRQLRRHRRPQEPFNIRSRPMEITPIMIHPVLPNESLDNLLFQVDAYSDPIVNRNIGWHANYQFYYVPLMALANIDYSSGQLNAENIANMMLDPAFLMSSVISEAAIAPTHYSFKGAVPWLSEAMTVIVNKFYRDEDDRSTGFTPATSMDYPLAYINQRSWIHSLKEESAGTDDPELPGVDEIEDLDILSGYSTHYSQWELMRDSGTENLTYDDYLKAQGVRLGAGAAQQMADPGMTSVVPELIRFVRKWTRPISTFDPTDGSAATGLRWSCTERADKTRYFKEPGFLIGVAVTTPKLYLGNQKGSIVGVLQKAEHWLPRVLQGFGYTSVTEVLDSVTDGPLINQDEDYWFDIGDLFNYGGAGFVNHTLGAAQHALAIPDGNPLNKRYLTEAEIKSLFVDSTNDQHIYQDGMVMLDILTTVPADQTPGSGL